MLTKSATTPNGVPSPPSIGKPLSLACPKGIQVRQTRGRRQSARPFGVAAASSTPPHVSRKQPILTDPMAQRKLRCKTLASLRRALVGNSPKTANNRRVFCISSCPSLVGQHDSRCAPGRRGKVGHAVGSGRKNCKLKTALV
jgi:hypothetical protein